MKMKKGLILLISDITFRLYALETNDITPSLKQLTISQFKARSTADNVVLISDFNKEGIFSFDPTESSSVNNDISKFKP